MTRDGQSAPSAVIPFSSLGWNYATDTNTGMYRSAADTQRIKVGGTDIVQVSSSGLDILSGALLFAGATNFALPPGLGPLPFAGSTAPSGWLLCYGQAVSRTTYALLFAAISTTYGAGDSSTTFNLPDLRGRLPAGKDDMGGTAASRLTTAGSGVDGLTLGSVGGAQNETVAQANLPAVSLAVTISAGQGSHTHTANSSSSGANAVNTGGLDIGQGTFYVAASADTPLASGTISAATLPAMTGTAPLGGSGTALTTVQPTIVTNYIIYAGV